MSGGADRDDPRTVILPAREADPEATRVLPPETAAAMARAGDPERTRVLAVRAAPAADAPAADAPLPAGYRLHEYRIERVLGQGGFGITYLATDVHLNARVAIKEYLPQQIARRFADRRVGARGARRLALYLQGLDNFLVEARTLAAFRHPNIVRVARFFEANGTAYMVLEYERGQSLREWWPAQRKVSERDLLEMLAPLLHGLETVHRAGFMHRDIKPDNISVRSADGSLVLLDFGSAGPRGGRDGEVVMVTPGYGPAEQYGTGEQGPWTDLYALGATLYWLLFGEKPPEATRRATADDPLRPAVERGGGAYSAEFLRAIDWALAPAAALRPQSVAEFRAALFAGDPAALALPEALAAGVRKRAAAPGAGPGRLLRPTHWRLSVKITVALVFAALVPMLLTAYYNLAGSTERVSAGELRNLTHLADSLAARVSQLLDDNRKLSRYLASDEALVAALHSGEAAARLRAQDRLDDLVASNPDVQLAMLFDAAGTARWSSDPEVAGRNFAFREYFQRALAGESYVSGVIVGAVAGEPGIFFAEPARAPDGRVIGAIVLRIRGAAVDAILARARQPGVREPILVDGDGVLLHHHDAALRYRSLAPLEDDRLQAIRADRRFRRDDITDLAMPQLASAMIGADAPGSIAYRSTISGVAEIAGYAPVAGHNWVVAVSEPRAYFEAPLRALFGNVLASVAVVGLLFVLIAVLFARSLLRPIGALTAAADALRGGNYPEAGVRVTSGDEIGELARTFNVMVDVLRQRERERERGRHR